MGTMVLGVGEVREAKRALRCSDSWKAESIWGVGQWVLD